MSTQVVLVTGATGFIGRHLVFDLLARGTTVRILARAPAKAVGLFGDRVEIIPGDVLNSQSLGEACRNTTHLYHVAGVFRFGPAHRQLCHAVNVAGTENVLAAAARSGVSKIVHVSSSGVLTSDGDTSDETGFPTQCPRFSPYKSSKWKGELRALEWAARGLPVVIASPTCPLGSGDEYPTPTGRILLDFLRGRMPFVSRTRLNFVDVEDLAAGLFAAMQRGTAGERYILGHSNVSLNDFLKIAGTQTGLKSPRHVLPGPVILAAGLVAECVGSVVPSWGNQLCLESAVQALHSQFFRMDKAREALGWEGTTPLTSSIQHAVEWFRHQAGEGLKEWSPPTLEPHVT